jgi:tRNA 2-thiouridine synthesizing protein E
MSTTLAPELLENIDFDAEGYMTNALQWTPEIAVELAKNNSLTLTERHWVVINFARHEYDTTGESPTIRRITKNSGVDTKELYQLFPGGPGKLVARIAGLKKPTGCI